MRSVRYGSQVINYSIHEEEGLKSHYIVVERHSGVMLKGRAVSGDVADKLVLKKAKWILNKLELVKPTVLDGITTGSRLPYLGKMYYVQMVVDSLIEKVVITFNHSRFIITVKSYDTPQKEIQAAIQEFYKRKAVEKIATRVEKLSQITGLKFSGLQFRHMKRRWGSCTGTNRIIINTEAVKLPFTLIDYLIVHELVHTKTKDHSKTFWKELTRYLPGWKDLDGRMVEMKL